MVNKNNNIISKDKAVIIALSAGFYKTQEYIDELAFLAKTMNINVYKSFVQNLKKPDKRTFVGKGKLEEIKIYCEVEKINIIIFDDDLTPSQLRNLEKVLNLKIYDRSLLILDIFLKRAQTSQAQTQVELARYQYLMPRLTRMWTHLERQKGGTSTRGGTGEKEIETDRRLIKNQISVLKKKLKKIDKQRHTRQKSRTNIIRVALVGYTNVGKSTIMNLLTKENTYVKDELFATIDSTTRKVVINRIPFLLSDTVGFIRKLPHNLIESFKSTLDEIREADILLHIVDVLHPSCDNQMEVVINTLKELGVADKEIITVYNKIDRLDEEELKLKNIETKTGNVFISASKKINIEVLKSLIYNKMKDKHLTIYPNYPGTYNYQY